MTRRPYVMTARAAAAEQTSAAILMAFTELFLEQPFAHVTLREVAQRAGVSMQTVIRRFGDKDGLTAAAAAAGNAAIAERRDTAVPGDLGSIVDSLTEHYAAQSRVLLKLLAEENSTPALAQIVTVGRQLHRRWCARVFAPWLESLNGVEYDRRLAQYVAICDVYTWKLLHEDCGLSRRQVRVALRELLEPLTTRST